MINKYFSKFVIQSKLMLGLEGTKDGQTPILNELELGGVNTKDLTDFLLKYGELMEWMTDCLAIDKQRQAVYTSLSKEQAAYEMKTCLADVIKKIMAENNQRLINSKK